MGKINIQLIILSIHCRKSYYHNLKIKKQLTFLLAPVILY